VCVSYQFLAACFNKQLEEANLDRKLAVTCGLDPSMSHRALRTHPTSGTTLPLFGHSYVPSSEKLAMEHLIWTPEFVFILVSCSILWVAAYIPSIVTVPLSLVFKLLDAVLDLVLNLGTKKDIRR